MSSTKSADFWGKTDGNGGYLPLLQHLYDTSAVAELLWDEYLSGHQKSRWDAATGNRGRDFFRLICALHDIGKATPAFQSKNARLLRNSELKLPHLNATDNRWFHSLAGAAMLRDYLMSSGWSRRQCNLWLPFLAGHHGMVPGAGEYNFPPRRAHCPDSEWKIAQFKLIDELLVQIDTDFAAFSDIATPNRADQLCLLGNLIMADWVASNTSAFPCSETPQKPSMTLARQRAQHGWKALGIQSGWHPDVLTSDAHECFGRFGVSARPFQNTAIEHVAAMTAPGLVIIEAPMGEGKTETALAAAELLAAKFGLNGIFVGMPTQATSDPMFSRTRSWAGEIDATTPIALLHGKARFNREWQELRAQRPTFNTTDEYGLQDEYGCCSSNDGQAPSDWFLGRKRGLLTPIAVGTVDQLLYAATRTRHVMLRHAGLAGKVVILDEVHAFDVYMSTFLEESLRWLAQAGVPMILLSATLPDFARQKLLRAYAQGLTVQRDITVDEATLASAYPKISTLTADSPLTLTSSEGATWRADLPVEFILLVNPTSIPAGSNEANHIVDLLKEQLADGGIALVIQNTVKRAQECYRACAKAFPDEVTLIHGRLTAASRAEISERLLDQLGAKPRTYTRPARHIVVATQVAEQSFDVDADVLITDIAPMDLLLQRAGRIHRHTRPSEQRPQRLSAPKVFVTGLRCSTDRPPWIEPGCAKVYGQWLLLRSAHILLQIQGQQVPIPAAVPELVKQGYDEQVAFPPAWQELADSELQERIADQSLRINNAQQFLLAGEDQVGKPNLAGLHERNVAEAKDEEVSAVVRDGDTSIEVLLIKRHGEKLQTLTGRPLGPNGEAISAPDVLEEVLGSSVRLPARESQDLQGLLEPFQGWLGDSWVGKTPVLVLNETNSANVGRWIIHYDHTLGLMTERVAVK